MNYAPGVLPRPLTGYVWYSNFGKTSGDGRKYDTREDVVIRVMESLEVPPEDVWVEPHQIPSCAMGWTAYVKNKHAAKVEALKRALVEGMRMFGLEMPPD